MNVIGILPAAGMAKRMQPYNIAKELLSVGYHTVHIGAEKKLVPMVVSQYVINAMGKAGIRNIFFIISPYKWEIVKFFASGAYWDMHFGYLCQDEPSGMPGAIDTAYAWVKDQMVVMGMPDTIIEPVDCFAQLLDFHNKYRSDLSLGIFPTQNPQSLAPVHLDPLSNRVIEIFDKPSAPKHFNTWGIAVWSSSFTELLHRYVHQHMRESKMQELLLSNVFSEAIEQGLHVYGKVFATGKFYDIGTPESLLQTRFVLEYPQMTDDWQKP